MKLEKRDQFPTNNPHSSRNISRASTACPKRKCQTMAEPPMLPVTTSPTTLTTSAQ
jgi:hypothetical protein